MTRVADGLRNEGRGTASYYLSAAYQTAASANKNAEERSVIILGPALRFLRRQ